MLFFVAVVAFVAAVIVEATETLPFELMILARGPLALLPLAAAEAGGGVDISAAGPAEADVGIVPIGPVDVAVAVFPLAGLFDADA